jgi:FkbM family methyltransferase
MPIATPDDVVACYRLILGREPDAEGLRVHSEAHLPVEAVVRSLVRSPEYQGRSPLITVPVHGLEFAVRSGETMYQHEPHYEHYLFGHLMPRIGPETTFVDVGANIGVFAIHAAHRGALAIAVEARPSNCALLLENARRLGVTVELHPLAVSDHHGYAVLDVAAENENAAIRRQEAGFGDHIVALGLLDELIGKRPVDILKIDIEGHEYRAMLGAKHLLSRCRPAILTEYHPGYQQAGSGVSGETYLRFLLEFGYRIRRFERTGDLQPVESTSELDELCARQGYHVDLWLER